jgi:hypothetical protein
MTDRQQQRETLIESILALVTTEIVNALESCDISEKLREKLKSNAIADTARILDACTLDELQSDSALKQHIESCFRDAQMLVRKCQRNGT